MASVILIDLSSIFWTCWHASEGYEVSSARNRTVSIVEQLERDHTFAAVCVDSGPYKRNEIFPDYKKGREHPPLATEELRQCARELKGFGIQCYASKGYEADDVIATLAEQAKNKLMNDEPIEVYVAGKDKDLLQIPNVIITDPFERKQITAEEKFGCPAAFVTDVLALSGDKADNIPGLTGIGPKKALQIIDVIGSVEKYLSGNYDKEAFVQLPEGVKRTMADEAANLALSLELVKLCYDVPINLILGEKKVEEIKHGETAVSAQTEPEAEIKQAETAVVVQPMKTEVAIRADQRNANWALALEPPDLPGAWKLATYLHASRLFGQFVNPEAVMAIILRGRSLGMDATTALSNFHVIEGKSTMHASLIVGLVLTSGKCEYFDLVETSDQQAVWCTKRIGRPELKFSYTIKEADTAGLLRVSSSGKKSNWQSRPKTMLRWRAATELARAVYPDITTGLYTPDEISDGMVETE